MAGVMFLFFEVMLFLGGAITVLHAFTEDEYSKPQRAAYVALGAVMIASAIGLLVIFVQRCFI